MVLKKVLFWGGVSSFSLFVLCFLIITISAIIYGYGDGITSDPTDSRIENGTVRYMEEAKYEIYRSVMRKVHLTGVFSVLIALVLNGLHSYITNKKDKRPERSELEQSQ